MLKISIQKTKFLAIAILLCCNFFASAQTPVAKYGQLKIFNGKVADANGNPVVLRGVSLFWSGYSEGAPFYNAATIKWLRDDWCVDVVRASMSVETGNTNYVGNPGAEYAKIKTVIDACIANGLYVVVDFHSHNANNYKAQANQFFTDIATAYGNTPNVLYEPFNEPVTQSWSGVVKPYLNEIIQTIRAKDPDNIIICGTTNFSQDVDIAANDQVTGTNIAYTLHYYANSHQGSLRQKATNALNKGVALFVTEYGTTNASGDGGYNPNEAQVWWDYVEANKLSNINWSIGNKGETSAILTQGTNQPDNWNSNQITQSGALVKAYIKGKCNVVVPSGSITLSFTGGKTQFKKGDAVTITATATVSTGTIAKVEFYSNGTLLGIGTGTTPTSTYSSSTLPSGGLNITAKSYTSTGALIGVSQNYTISIVGSSNVSTTGVTDQFESATQYSEITGALNSPTCSNANTAAATGVFWFDDVDPATPFKATYTRAGDGKLKYVISQAFNSYNVVGFNFGEYCAAGAKKKYTLDLTKNAVLKLTVSAPATNVTTLDLKIQMKDEDGTSIVINKAVLKPDGTVDKTKDSKWYKYEIGFSKNHDVPDYQSLAPGTTSNFTFDFKNALTIQNPLSPTFPADINNNNTDFDFSKVVEVIIIPVNSEDDLEPTFRRLAFTDQQIIFSGLTLGDPSLGVDICTTPPAAVPQNVSYCQDATDATELSAIGILGLTQKWYTTATGGTGGDVVPIPSTNTPGKTTYYVSQATSSTSTCEGPRSALDVTVVAAPTANAGVAQTNAKGPSVTLTGSGSAVGTWKLVSGQPGTTVSFAPSANAATVTANGLSVLGNYTFSYTVPGTAPCVTTASNVVVTVTTITALENDAYLNENIEIYPNPATDNLFVNLSKVNGSKSMKMMDMFGKVVFESSNQSSVNVDMSNLNKGMYIVQIQSESGKLSRTVIKQ